MNYPPLAALTQQFQETAYTYGRLIISERALAPDARSIKPINPARSELQPAGDSVTNLLPSIGDIPKLNSQLPNFKPLDDFDPEIFNRLYIDQKN